MWQRPAALVAVLAVGVGLASCGGSASHVGSSAANAGAGAGSGAGASTTSGKSRAPGGRGGAGSAGTGGSSQLALKGSHGGYVDPLAAAAPSRHLVSSTEVVHITSQHGSTIVQQGLVTGSPISNGTVVVRAHVAGGPVTSSFTVDGADGSVTGRATVQLLVTGGTVTYHGTARLTGGTGRYTRVRAPQLTVAGSGDIRGTRMIIHVSGSEWY